MKKEIQIPTEVITNKIYIIRREKVLIDSDLAKLYGVETRTLKQAVRRNIDRFPGDFMFQLTKSEWMSLSQIVISSEIINTAQVLRLPLQNRV
ncbi:ORF6N domain protein [bacterium BMS3Abin03]|nr:ORF6N domain protein [bacterium BMS3Abin03]